jgi:hypothetical protein
VTSLETLTPITETIPSLIQSTSNNTVTTVLPIPPINDIYVVPNPEIIGMVAPENVGIIGRVVEFLLSC